MRDFRSVGRAQARRGLSWGGRLRRLCAVVVTFAMLPLLMGARAPGEHTPMPTIAGIRGTIVRAVDWLTDTHTSVPKPAVPKQQAGKAPGKQHQVPAAVTRAVARAQGHAPGPVRCRRMPPLPPR